MTPGILTAIISALTALAIPAALACFVLAGLRLRAEGGVNYDAGGGFFKWLLWAAVFLTLPGISLWLSNNGVPTLPSSSSGGTYAYITGWQTVLTAFVNDIVIQHLVPVLAATLVVKAILDWAEGNSPIPSVITSLCLLGVQGIDSLATGSWLIYLAESKKYLHTGDLLNARSCAREGLEFIVGIPFPFAVRDQLHDVLNTIAARGPAASAGEICSSASRD